jgi:peptidoglycan/LPS O-acetylase OafA/YrhL
MYSTSRVEAFRSKVARTLTSRNLAELARPALRRSDVMLRVTSGRFRPEIDGLRFFAIIPVLLSHLFQQVLRRQNRLGFLGDIDSSGYHYFVNHLPGVLLFFAISGYILSYQITNAAREGYDWSKYGKYVLRRFKRIAPPYYVVLLATFITVAVIGFKPSGGIHFEASQVPLLPSLIVSFFYSHWLVYDEWPRLFGAGWTLEIETQYYVIAPFLTLIYLRLRNKRTRIAVGIFTIALTSVIASQYEVGNFWAGTIMKFFPYFFAGMLALELQDDLKDAVKVAPRAMTDLVTVAAVFFYLSVQAPESGAGMDMFEYYVVNITCVMTMFIAVSIEDNILRRICVTRWVVIVGGACYSIYLTHYQVIFLVMNFLYKHVVFEETYLAMIFYAAVEGTIAVLVGLAFYQLIERPFMVWGRNGRKAPLAPVSMPLGGADPAHEQSPAA